MCLSNPKAKAPEPPTYTNPLLLALPLIFLIIYNLRIPTKYLQHFFMVTMPGFPDVRGKVFVTTVVTFPAPACCSGLIRGSVSQTTPRGSQLHLFTIVLVLYCWFWGLSDIIEQGVDVSLWFFSTFLSGQIIIHCDSCQTVLVLVTGLASRYLTPLTVDQDWTAADFCPSLI